jgi:hypothetical protein
VVDLRTDIETYGSGIPDARTTTKTADKTGRSKTHGVTYQRGQARHHEPAGFLHDCEKQLGSLMDTKRVDEIDIGSVLHFPRSAGQPLIHRPSTSEDCDQVKPGAGSPELEWHEAQTE